MKYTLFGAGGIGGSMAGFLRRAGMELLFVDANREHVDAMNQKGLTIQHRDGDFIVPVTAKTPNDLSEPLEVVFLSTKTQHTQEALKTIAPLLREDGYVVSLQNGINEYAIAKAVGRERTVGALVNWAADYMAPGVIRFGGYGHFVLGELDGCISPRVLELQRELSPFCDVALSAQIMSPLWSKQINIGIMFCTGLTHLLIPGGLEYPSTQETIACLALEQMQVPRALGIELERLEDFDPFLLRQGRYQEALRITADHYRYMTKNYTGLYRDLAVRKRRSEIDGTVGETVRIGEELGLQFPLSKRMIELVKDIEEGSRELCNENLLALKEAYERFYPRGLETFFKMQYEP